MITNPDEKSQMAEAVLRFIPPVIRESLINKKDFRHEYRLKTDATVVFGSPGIRFQRTKIFNAARTVFARDTQTSVKDTENRIWNLRNDESVGELPRLVLTSGLQNLFLPDLSILSENLTTRIRSLEQSCEDVFLPLSDQEVWRSILKNRPLEDEEVDSYFRDLHDTPAHIERTLLSELKGGQSAISTLVPCSRRYFNRLVGTYDESSSIQEYAVGGGRVFLKQLSERRSYEGFLYSLFLSAHSALTFEINPGFLDQKKLEGAFELVVKHGDPLSYLGAIEVGLRILQTRPEIEPFLKSLLGRIRNDNAESNVSEFVLFSSLFILVDGELARTRLMSQHPPFYRRLASLAQAALIHRQLVRCGINYQHFSDWAVDIRGQNFYIQSLVDMRAEPRWNPNLATGPQLQADFLGRIIIAGNKYKDNLVEEELRNAILGDKALSLIRQYKYPFPFFPGPLEGGEKNQDFLPEEFSQIIEKQLNAKRVEATSFIALVNSAMLFQISTDHAELAAKALRLGNYSLANLKDKSQLINILDGLATVAAISRNLALSHELRFLLRRYRRDTQFKLTIDEAIRICLVASAAWEDPKEWRKFVGEYVLELAFGDLQGNEGEVLHSHLLAMLHSEPELWISCARAEAALQAWCFR